MADTDSVPGVSIARRCSCLGFNILRWKSIWFLSSRLLCNDHVSAFLNHFFFSNLLFFVKLLLFHLTNFYFRFSLFFHSFFPWQFTSYTITRKWFRNKCKTIATLPGDGYQCGASKSRHSLNTQSSTFSMLWWSCESRAVRFYQLLRDYSILYRILFLSFRCIKYRILNTNPLIISTISFDQLEK